MAGYSKSINSWAGFSGKKGPGYCAICGGYGKLTRDHVPPQGCIQITSAVLSRLAMEENVNTRSRNTIYIQGGLKFQTLFSRCNSELLGRLFDPELKYLVDSMRTGLQKISMNVVLPRIVSLEANTHLVARAVIGHILAGIRYRTRRHGVKTSEHPKYCANIF